MAYYINTSGINTWQADEAWMLPNYNFLSRIERGGTTRAKHNKPDVVIRLNTQEDKRQKWYAILIWKTGSSWLVRCYAGEQVKSYRISGYHTEVSKRLSKEMEFEDRNLAAIEIAKIIAQKTIKKNRAYCLQEFITDKSKSTAASITSLENEIKEYYRKAQARHSKTRAELLTSTDLVGLKTLDLKISNLSDKQLNNIIPKLRHLLGDKLIESQDNS